MTLSRLPTPQQKPATRYAQIAAAVTQQIDAGALLPGDKLPSVRKLSLQYDVSISTVLQAYRVLEEQRKIEARPQSGYYVRTRLSAPPAEPAMTQAKPTSTPVSVGDVVLKWLQQEGQRQGMVPLGGAIPGPSSIPSAALGRLGAAIARRSPARATSYDMPPGCPALRAQIAHHMVEAKAALGPDDIITTCGGQEALGLCLRAVARPGDTIAVESPTFWGVLQMMELLGMKVVQIPTHPRDGVSLEALEFAMDQTPIAACLFIPNHNNPLGSVMPEANKRKLVETLAARNVPLIEDDIYGDLPFGPQRPGVCKAYDRHGLVLTCSSFSKTLAPGYRVGWCAPGRFRDEVMKLKLYNTLATATLPQLTIAEFMAGGGYAHHLRKVRRVYEANVRRMTDKVAEHFPPGTKLTRPAGGLVLWVELPEAVDSMALHDRALGRNIAIAPGHVFSPKDKFTHFVRLNCGLDWSPDVDKALVVLGELVRQMC